VLAEHRRYAVFANDPGRRQTGAAQQTISYFIVSYQTEWKRIRAIGRRAWTPGRLGA